MTLKVCPDIADFHISVFGCGETVKPVNINYHGAVGLYTGAVKANGAAILSNNCSISFPHSACQQQQWEVSEVFRDW